MGLFNLLRKIFKTKKEDYYGDENLDLDDVKMPDELKLMMERQKYEEANKHSAIRRKGEQSVIPWTFYNDTKMFLNDLDRAKEGVIQEIFSIPYVEMDEEPQYTMEDFKITKEELKENISIVKLDMPTKNMFVRNCHRIYFIYDSKLNAINYFTIEESIGQKMLCSIDKEGNRFNYGIIESESLEREKIISMI